jgi:uncharacterized membrane protein HdeD (DUF308 family)
MLALGVWLIATGVLQAAPYFGLSVESGALAGVAVGLLAILAGVLVLFDV